VQWLKEGRKNKKRPLLPSLLLAKDTHTHTHINTNINSSKLSVYFSVSCSCLSQARKGLLHKEDGIDAPIQLRVVGHLYVCVWI
jgi:hypothetical protein